MDIYWGSSEIDNGSFIHWSNGWDLLDELKPENLKGLYTVINWWEKAEFERISSLSPINKKLQNIFGLVKFYFEKLWIIEK